MLDNRIVVRADVESDVNGVGKRDSGKLLGRQRVSVFRDGHYVGTVASLQLYHRVRVRQTIGGLVLFRRSTGGPPELERHESVAMERGGDVWRAGRERWTNRPAELAVRLDPPANEMSTGGENEIAGHPLPHEVKVVAIAPHVLTRSANPVLLKLIVVHRGAGAPHVTDVALSLENTDSGLRAEAGTAQCDCGHARECTSASDQADEIRSSQHLKAPCETDRR